MPTCTYACEIYIDGVAGEAATGKIEMSATPTGVRLRIMPVNPKEQIFMDAKPVAKPDPTKEEKVHRYSIGSKKGARKPRTKQ